MTGTRSPPPEAAKPKLAPAAPSNRGIPAEEVSGKEHDDVFEREAVYDVIKRHSRASWGRSLWELAHTIALTALAVSFFPNPLAVVVFGLLRVRSFIIFHDCAHGAYFPSATANWVVGTVLGAFNHASYSFWSRGHNHHHRHSNNTKYDQFSQSNPWTLATYNKATPYYRFMYRATYTPLAFLFVMPYITFTVFFSYMAKWWENVLQLAMLVAAWRADIVGAWIVSYSVAAGMGFYLFHMQHTFEGTHRWIPSEWSFFENGMSASSFLQVPALLKYFTGNIEYHHIHHLSPLVPLYNLPQCHAAAGKLFDRVPRVGFLDGFKMLTPMVWDEDKAKLVAV